MTFKFNCESWLLCLNKLIFQKWLYLTENSRTHLATFPWTLEICQTQIWKIKLLVKIIKLGKNLWNKAKSFWLRSCGVFFSPVSFVSSSTLYFSHFTPAGATYGVTWPLNLMWKWRVLIGRRRRKGIFTSNERTRFNGPFHWNTSK